MASAPQKALNFLMTNSSTLHFVVDAGIGRAVERSNFVVARIEAPLVVGGMLVGTFIELAVLGVKLPLNLLQSIANVRVIPINLSLRENLEDIGRIALRIVFFTAAFFVSVIIPKTLFAALGRAHVEERCRDCQTGRTERRSGHIPTGAGVGRPVDERRVAVDESPQDLRRRAAEAALARQREALAEQARNAQPEGPPAEVPASGVSGAARGAVREEALPPIERAEAPGNAVGLDATDEDNLFNELIEAYRANVTPAAREQIDALMAAQRLTERRPARAREIMEILDHIQAQALDRGERSLQRFVQRFAEEVLGAAVPGVGGPAAVVRNQEALDAAFEEARDHHVLESGIPPEGARNADVQRYIQNFVHQALISQYSSFSPPQRPGADYTDQELTLATSIWNTTLSVGRQAYLIRLFGEDRGNALSQFLEMNPPQMGERGYAPEQLQLFHVILTQIRGAGAGREEYVRFATELFGEEVAEEIVTAFIGGGEESVNDPAEDGEEISSRSSTPTAPTPQPPAIPQPAAIPQDAREDHRVLGCIHESVEALVESYRGIETNPDLRRADSEPRTRGEVALGEKIFHISHALYRSEVEPPEAQEALFTRVFGAMRGQSIYRMFRSSPRQLTTYTVEQRALAITVFQRYCQGATEADIRQLFGTLFENQVVAEKLASHIWRDEIVRRHRENSVHLDLERDGRLYTTAETELFQEVWRLSSTDSEQEKQTYFTTLCGDQRGGSVYTALRRQSLAQRRVVAV